MDLKKFPVQPRVLAKEIAKIFRGKDAPVDERRPVGDKKAGRMTVPELVAALDPEEPTSAVGKRLGEISKGQPFIVYDSGRVLDVANTLKILLEIKQIGTGRETLVVNGNVKKVYKLGELPDNYADENPLYEGRPLRPDGTCDQTNRSWEGVPLETRQMIRLAMKTGELKIDSIDKAHAVLDFVLQNNIAAIKVRYQKAAIEFQNKPDDRPKLKITLGESKGGGSGRPFDGGTKVQWDGKHWHYQP